jgi:predicted MFS family arabinose efflux permease
MREYPERQGRLTARLQRVTSHALVPPPLDRAKSETGRSIRTIYKGGAFAASLGFAVTAQMTVYLLFGAVPVIAPEIANNRGLDVQLIAFYYPLAYTVAFFSNFSVPRLLSHLGGAGLSLVCIAAGAVGLLLMLPTAPLLIVTAPLVLGFAIGGITPATSQAVGHHTSPRTAGLIMSIRQSAISAGSMLAGVLMPILAIHWGRHALLVIALASAGFAIILLPTLRSLNDRRSTPPAAQRPLDSVKRLLAMSSMRRILVAVLTYLMMVSCLRSFFTVYLVRDLGFDLAEAGLVFSAAQLAGIPGQVGCAVVSDRWLPPSTVLALNGAFITVAAILAANFTPHWPISGIVSVAIVLGFFSVGCVPVMLGEVARRSPPGEVGCLVSGANTFIMAGCALGPLLFGAAGTRFGYSGGLVALAMCTLAGAIVVAPLAFRRNPGRLESAESNSRDRIGTSAA